MYNSPYIGGIILKGGYGSCSKMGNFRVKFFSKNLEK
jgi:hypothetical protein